MKLKPEEVERFAQEMAISGDPSAAYLKAKPDTKASQKSIWSTACRWSKQPEVIKRIDDFKRVMQVKAESKFSITVEKRLQWLQEIVEAGLGTYHDNNGNARRENLAAAKGAIEVLNDMLGTGDDDAEKGESLEITFQVSAPKRDIRITKGDAG